MTKPAKQTGSLITTLLEQIPPFIPEPAQMMTATVELPPGDPGGRLIGIPDPSSGQAGA